MEREEEKNRHVDDEEQGDVSIQELRVNDRIRVPQVRLIGPDGEQLGVVSKQEALAKAYEAELDLVEVAPLSNPPVCRVMDYSKYKYDQSKKEKESKKKQHLTQFKEVKFRPRIEEHDYQFKLDHLKKFIERGDKVKVTLMFRGRELARPELGQRVMDRLVKDTAAFVNIERPALREGRMIIMVVAPKTT